MPKGLDQLYNCNWTEKMRLEGHYQCRALAILCLVTFALRRLTVQEITDALVVVHDDGCDNLCINDLPNVLDED
jgi:hypothetical protein